MEQKIKPTPGVQQPTHPTNPTPRTARDPEFESGKEAAQRALGGKMDADLLHRKKTKLDKLVKELRHREAMCSDLYRKGGPRKSSYNCGFAQELREELKYLKPKAGPIKSPSKSRTMGDVIKKLLRDLEGSYTDKLIDESYLEKKMYPTEIY